MSDSQLSRRQMIALLGLGGAVVAGTCSGLTALAVVAMRESRRRQATPQIVQITATPAAPDYEYPRMIRRWEWGAPPPDHTARNESGFYHATLNPEGWYTYAEPLSAACQTVVVHHSVIDDGANIATLRRIVRTHRDDRGWADIGYHYLIGQDGRVYEGRQINARGVHVAGYNTGSVGVCLLGNYAESEPPAAQINATRDLVTWLAERLALSHIAAHNDFNTDTECPGANLKRYIDDFARFAGLQVGTAGYIPPPA